MSPVGARTRALRRRGTLLAAGAFTLSLAALAGLRGASAHPGDDDLARWYRSLRVPGTGGSCCDMVHCHQTDARLVDDRWEIPIEREDGVIVATPVPPEAVLRRENAAGYPVVCIIGGKIVCFVPGDWT